MGRATMKDYDTSDCWRAHGLGTTATAQAEGLLPAMLAIVRLAPKSVMEAIFREAQFQFYELPLRNEAFRQQYLADAPDADVAAIRAFEPIVSVLHDAGYDVFDLVNEAFCNVVPAGDEESDE